MLEILGQEAGNSNQVSLYRHMAQYYETDQMGIVHHSNYIRWFEEARVDFLEQIGFGYKRMEEEGVISPVLSVSCQYHSMVQFHETVIIVPKIEEFNGIKFKISYRILGEDGMLKTTGESVHCFLGKDFKPLRIRREKPELFHLFEQFLGFDPLAMPLNL